ncbi:hypothetical protein [Undibacterium crateris]|uniref:hypothetical protein n=1 Tax=Undibacterium crateris TaxID=2528175 RepID=UPI001389DB54|nr:hypothetical protein [Undibacterium crateris]NDI85036.1 hypothetical protein [Undibacterium crateris]
MCDLDLVQFYAELYAEALRIASMSSANMPFSAKTLASESILIADVETAEAIIKRMMEDGKITETSPGYYACKSEVIKRADSSNCNEVAA